MSTNVNYDNINSLLVGIVQNLKPKIAAIDLTQTQKDMLVKLDKIIKTGTGTSFLSDNGSYKNIPIDQIQNMLDKLTTIYSLFGITNVTEHWDSTGILNMPTARYYLTSQIYNGKIYCIGGTNGTVFNKVEIYDIASNSWTTGTNMTTARYGLTSQIYNGKIYCIGGCISGGNNSNIVEIYDIVNNIWNTSVAMSSARYYLTSQIYNGKMYCIGGTNGGYLNIVETLWLFCNVYTITLPSIIQTKLNKILTSGTGVNIFRNDGTYKPIVPVYNVMDSATINTFLSGL